MRRRDFLRFGVGLGTPAITGALRAQRSVAQPAQRYELSDIVTLDDFVHERGRDEYGAIRAIANDGTIVGDKVIDGLLTPLCWSPDGRETVLDPGFFAGTHISAKEVISSGRIVGESYQVGRLDLNTRPDLRLVYWDDFGIPVVGPAGNPDRGVFIEHLAESGIAVGSVASQAARWDADQLTMLDVTGAVESRAHAISAIGAVAGSYWPSLDGTVSGLPAVWSRDGMRTLYDAPIGFVVDQQIRLRVRELTDDGGLVMSILQNTGSPNYAVRYAADGTQSMISGLTDQGHEVDGSNSAGILFGRSWSDMAAIPTIPTVWFDDQPFDVNTLFDSPLDRTVSRVYDINDTGTMVGVAEDTSGIRYGVRLDPI